MARTGKIARLPETIRTELNRRLRDGASGSSLLPWLNALPEVRTVLEADFGGRDISAPNLTDWRQGGYEDWVRSTDRLHHTRLLAEKAAALAREAGGSLTEGAAAILSGRILEVLEGLDEETNAEQIGALIKSVAVLRGGDQDQRKIEQREKELALARANFDQKLLEYQDKVAAQKREIESALGTAKAGGLTPEVLQRIEEAAKLL